MKKTFFTILFVSATFLITCKAQAVVIQQTDSSVMSGPISGTSVKIQKLGSGLTGTLTSYSVYFATSPTGLGGTRPAMQIRCYDDAAYAVYNSSCSGTETQFGLVNSNVKTLYTSANGVTFNPTKYYAVSVRCYTNCASEPPVGSNAVLKTYGSSSDTYSGGNFSSGYGITDLYFVLNITGGNYPVPHAADPAIASTTQAAGQSAKDNLFSVMGNGLPYIILILCAFVGYGFVLKKVRGQGR